MQASQRARCNHALERAVRRADDLDLPVVACFGLTDEYPDANERHYAFLLEGLAETAEALAERGIRLVLRAGRPAEVAADLAERAAMVVVDRGYLRHQVRWGERLARQVDCRVERVESDALVPVEVASDRAEYAARTIRPKLRREWDRYLRPLEQAGPDRDSLDLDLDGLDPADTEGLLAGLDLDRSVGAVSFLRGGTSRADDLLDEFIAEKLARYADQSRDNVGVNFAVEPRFLAGSLARVGGVPVAPVGAFGLE
jgi:deoxyribodipyrimidine photo-lyase